MISFEMLKQVQQDGARWAKTKKRN